MMVTAYCFQVDKQGQIDEYWNTFNNNKKKKNRFKNILWIEASGGERRNLTST